MKNGGLTSEAVAAKLRELHGNMAAVARHFGVSRQAVWKFVQDRDGLRQITAECRESMKDHAESSLYSAIFKGEAWAVCFYLKCQAKDRGYVERTEHTGADGGPIQTEIRELVVRTREEAAAALAALSGPAGVP